MEKIADIIVQNIMEIRHVEHEQKEILKFGIQIFMEMGINLIVSIGIMLILHKVPEGIFFYLVFIPVRIYSGGYHSNTYLGCFLLSTITFIFVLVTCQKWHLPRGYSIWCIVVLTSLIWKIRPVINESRPVSTEEYKRFVSKLKVVLIVIVMVAVVLEINHNNIYLNIMISGLLLTAITLIMGKVKYRQYKT